MPENFLYNLIYSVLAGLTEFLGVDATAHRMLYQQLSGQTQPDPVLNTAVRLGVLIAVILCCRERIQHLWHQRRISMRSRRRHNRPLDPVAQLDLRLLKAAAIPVVLSALLYSRAESALSGLPVLALMLGLNGLLLFVPRLFAQANKDGRSVSRLDGLLLGLSGIAALVPGFSLTGSLYTAGSARGLDRQYSLDVALLLTVPLLGALLILDLIGVIFAKVAVDLIGLLLYLLFALVAFGCGCLSVWLLRKVHAKSGMNGFAYYSWGVALFTFILYLMI